MARQFLYDLGILSVRVQECPKSVPKGVIKSGSKTNSVLGLDWLGEGANLERWDADIMNS
jgi:hypothetical protein